MAIQTNERSIETTTKVCMISGKGGCGKTATSLVIAKLLAAAHKKVLVIDCDMTTQGASCFLHNLITNSKTTYPEIACIDNIVIKTTSDSNDFKLTGTDRDKVSKIICLSGIYFIPFNIDKIEDGPITPHAEALKNIVEGCMDGNFDVVIFDCQAGYSNFTIDLVEMCDKVIFMNSDDVSSETTTELLRGRLLNVAMQKQRFVIRNKWFNSKDKRHKYTNQLMNYTPPIMFYKQVGRDFTLNVFETLDFHGKNQLPLKYLLDVIHVTKEFLYEYTDDIEKIEKNIQIKLMHRRLLLSFGILGGLIVLISFLTILHLLPLGLYL